MRSGNEKHAADTWCLGKGFEEAWAHFRPSKPCVSLSIDGMETLRKNQIYECVIEGYSSEGHGVCRIGGRAVFVPRTITGETWRVRLVKVGAAAVYGRAEELIEASPARVEPLCPYFGKCGGCDTWHMSYEEELRFKLGRVNDALRHIGKQTVAAKKIIPSESITRYRNKGIFAVADSGSGPVSGFYRERSHDMIEVKSCLIQSELSDRAAAAVTAFMRECGIPAYDEQSGRGAVRHVFSRVAVNTGDAVVCIVANRGFGADTPALVSALRAACPELTGIVLNINKTRGNTVLAGDFYTLWGKAEIRDILCGFEFEIAPQAFFQINPPQAEKLYAKAVEYAFERDVSLAFDLYCGAGTISLCLSRHAERVIGAEIVPEAIENAKKNAAENGVGNVSFICADAGTAAESLSISGLRPDVVVVDPPRKGMDEAAIAAVSSMLPERIVYVSCDPATLARDILRFNSHGYSLAEATAVDMFPRTSHVETVVLLSREPNPLTVEVRMEVETGEVKEHPTYKRIQEYVQEKYGFKVHAAYIAEVKRMVGLDMHKAPNAVEQRKREHHPCPSEKVEAIKDALRHFGLIAE